MNEELPDQSSVLHVSANRRDNSERASGWHSATFHPFRRGLGVVCWRNQHSQEKIKALFDSPSIVSDVQLPKVELRFTKFLFNHLL